jgi:hypothetical protein
VGPACARGARCVRQASLSTARRQRARMASPRRALGARLGASRSLDRGNVGAAADAVALAVLGRARGSGPRRRTARRTTITRPMPRYGSGVSPSRIRNGSR